ncbi:MAG: hypothetical protein U0529_02305 [Thermoanaerobaculia bacterium]
MNAREAAYTAIDSLLHRLVESRPLRSLFSLFTFPSAHTDLLTPGIRSWLRTVGLGIFLASLFLLLVVNAIWAAVDRRFVAAQGAGLRNFVDDWPNIANYGVICPLYLVFGLAFIVHVRQLRPALRMTRLWEAIRVDPPAVPRTGLRVVVASAVVLVASLVSLSHYFEEIRRYPYAYWFQGVSPSGERILNSHGYYYLLTNLLLNLVVMAVIAGHFEMFAVSVAVGRAIRSLSCSTPPPGSRTAAPPSAQLTPATSAALTAAPTTTSPATPLLPTGSPLLQKSMLASLFRPFSSLYALSKVFIVLILANLYTWRAAKPLFVGTLEVTVLVVALLGVAVVSFPRYHIQYRLFQLWRANGIEEYPEIRHPLARGTASLADVLILGGAMTNLLAYVLQKSGVQLSLS